MPDKIVPFELPKDSDALGHLYQITYYLEPESRLFDDVAPYVLFIWLFARSEKSAGEKAYAVVQQLPYAVAPEGENICCRVLLASTAPDDSNPDLNAAMQRHEEIARTCVLSLLVISGPKPESKPGAA